ncbi:hypothetical protein [Nostoc sp. PCC 9305]|uniref:hypothetical protein n=1 Tax=Nostoc sp. PCC 9305 TaxID=296636 RepID=UPI0039C5B3C3
MGKVGCLTVFVDSCNYSCYPVIELILKLVDMKKVKTIEIKNLQAPEIEELSDGEAKNVVGGFAAKVAPIGIDLGTPYSEVGVFVHGINVKS